MNKKMKNAAIATVVAMLGAAFAVFVAQPALASHALTGVSPSTVAQNRTGVAIIVNGTGFSSTGGAPKVSVSGTGVTVQSTTMNNASQLTAVIDVAPDAGVGARTVTVKQGLAGIDSADCTNCLHIVDKPTITSISPPQATNRGSLTMVLSGSHFTAGAVVTLVHGSTTIAAGTSSLSVDGNTLSAPIDLTGASPYTYQVRLTTNVGGGSATYGDGVTTGFLVAGSTPTLTSVSPSTAGVGSTGRVLTLTGTNIAKGATVTVGGSGVSVTGTAWQSLTSMTATISVAAGSATGARDVTITNTDGQSATKTGALTVVAGPTVSGLSPNMFGQGATSRPVQITGANFAGTPTVSVSGTGVTIDSVSSVAATQFGAKVTVAPGAALGTRDVTVTNSDGGKGTKVAGLTVTAGPSISTINPTSRGAGATAQDIQINGSNFSGTPTVSFGTGIVVNSVTGSLPTQRTASITVAANAPIGLHDVTITNPDGGTFTKTGGFTVGSAPIVSAVAPATIGQGATGRTIVITGANFVAVPEVAFSAAGVTVTHTAFDSATQLTLTVDAATNAAVGASNLTITNPDAGTITNVGAVTVGARPTISTIVPSAYGRGFSGTVTINGANFQATPSIAVSGTGITITNVARVSATQLTAMFTVAGNAPLGARDITITNPDAGVSAVCTACATVNAGPAITSISPNGGANDSTIGITINGSGFASNATAVLQRTGEADIPLTGVTVNAGGTQLSGSADLTRGGHAPAAPGQWSIKVVNPTDAGMSTLANSFTVAGDAPTVSTATPSSVPQGVQKTVTLTGTNFASGATVAVSGTGVTTGTPTVVSATRIDVPVTVAANAASGARNITVTNTDGQSGGCTGCISVSLAPTVTSVSPNTVGQGASSAAVTVKGTNFAGTPSVSTPCAGVTLSSVALVDAATLTLRINVPSTATPGACNLTVTNPDGGAGTLSGAFTITAAPTVASVSPNALGQGATNRTVTITGTNFGTTPTLSFSGTGVSVASLTRVSATQLSAVVTVANNAATGGRSVTVTNADGGTSTTANALTIGVAPTVTSLSPNKVQRGQSSVAVTITGTNFNGTPTVAVSGTGVTVDSVNRTSATQITAQITATTGATSGGRDVTVTNGDGGTGTGTGVLTITDRDVTFSPWITVTLGANSGTTATDWGPGHIDVFYRALDNTLGHKAYVNGSWVSTQSLGGGLTSAPSAVSWGNGRIDVFVKGTDNQLWHRAYQDATGWSNFEPLGGQLTSAPTAASWTAGRLDVFVKGTDNQIWHTWYDSGWHAFEPLGGALGSAPAAVSWSSNRIDIVYRGTDNALWHKWFDGAWRGPESFGGSYVGDVGITSWAAGRLDVFVTQNDKTLGWKTFNGTWTGVLPLAGAIGAGPSATSWSPNHIDVFAQGANQELLWRTGS